MTRPFCGRARELDALRHAYRDVAWGPNPEPRLVTLVAESGLGKTRLVQEFYRWLATAEDGGSGYWPADLSVVNDNLLLNPDPSRCDNTRPVPFLWWGLRLLDPGARNQAIAGQLASSLDTLTPHLEPVLRTERRRQAGKGMAMTVGNVALDFAVNAAPALGLLKTLGQAAFEFGQHAHAMWRATEDADPGRIQDQRREELVDRIVSDFALLLDGKRAETSVPAVIVIDDGQFSEHDPSIVAFVEKMLAAAVAGRWRVLFIVTYWTAEWNRHFEDDAETRTIGRVIRERRADLGDWQPLHLPPVDDLSTMVREALPGLAGTQQQALVDRAGGNPRYLDEILRFCERNPRLFEGRSLGAPLTEKGLQTLLERTVDLHELVEERLGLLDPDVRRALLLASVQGQEFLVPLVAEVSAGLHESAGEPELDKAEHPHAFIHRQPGRLGAFAQRVFHEVAVAQVANDFDEDEVHDALREAIRRRLDAFDALVASEEPERIRTCLLAIELLCDTGDHTDAVRAATALVHLVHAYQQRHEYQLAWRMGDRLVEHLAGNAAAQVPAYAFHVAATTLMERGRYGEALRLLDSGIAAQRQRMQANPDAATRDILAVLLDAAGRAAQDDGRLGDAVAYLEEALGLRRAAANETAHPLARRDVLVTCLNLGDLARRLRDLEAAARLYDEAQAIAIGLDAEAPTPGAADDVISTLLVCGDLAIERGDLQRARAMFDEGLARLDATTAAGADALFVGARRPALHERVARVARGLNDLERARHELEKAVTLRHQLAEQAGTARAQAALADALRSLGDVHWDRQDLAAAWQAFTESLQALDAVASDAPPAFVRRSRSLVLERVGRTALVLDDHDAATEIFEQRLEQDQAFAEAEGTTEAWRLVLTSEFWLADIAEQRGDAEAAEERFSLALSLARDMLAYRDTLDTRDDVRRILRRLSQLARTRGDEEAAAALEAEATALSGPTV